MPHITATFEITTWDATPYGETEGAAALSRVLIKKTFSGDVVGNSTATMLSSYASDEKAGYVAMERFIGQIGERQGSFDMQHGGIVGDGTPQQFGNVVPGSGTGDFTGLIGEVRFGHDENGAVFTIDYDFQE